MKKFLTIFVALAVVLAISLSVSAAVNVQDEVEIAISTDKQSYTAEDQIVAVLAVKNNHGHAVKNVALKCIAPKGYYVTSLEGVQTVASLGSNETASLTVTLAPETSPSTGDNSTVLPFVALLVLSLAGIVAVCIIYRKNWKGMVSMLLCLVMVLSLLPVSALQVSAAEEAESVSETASTTVTVDGASVKIEGTVTYQVDDCCSEPEATQPETTEPEATQPEATQPEATQPEATQPEATQPETTEPEATEPETTEPEATQPETTEPEATEPETTEPEATEPETTEPVYATGLSEGSSIFTEEKLAAAKENLELYEWAASSTNVIKFTEQWGLPYVDALYEIIGAVGSKLPISSRVGTKNDSKYAKCDYCGQTASWDGSLYNLGHQWKIKCKKCNSLFPSNDFGSFYKLGLVNGIFDYETALNKHHELFGDKTVEKPAIDVNDRSARNAQWDEISEQWYAYYGYGNPEGYLYNESFADVRESNMDPQRGVEVNGAVWGVDDGYGYFSNYSYEKNGNTYHEINAYIAFYLYRNGVYALYRTYQAAEAYILSGNEDYGFVGAVLADRWADVFPNAYVEDFYYVYGSAADGGKVFDNYYLSTGGGHEGKLFGRIADGTYMHDLIRGVDAIIPVLQGENEELLERVTAFLSEKAEEYGLENKKESGDAIWQNIANNLIYETYEASKSGDLAGNAGIEEAAVAMAALVLNEDEGRGKEIMDYVFAVAPKVGEAGYDATNVLGLNAGGIFINRLNRDGTGDENAPAYNLGWAKSYMKLAGITAAFSDDPAYNLYANPKFALMMASGAAVSLVEAYQVQIGDSTGAASLGFTDTLADCVEAFKYLKDTAVAETLAEYIYMRSGGDVSTLYYDVYTPDPESIREEIQALVGDDGVSAKSQMLAGFGFAVLRDGKKTETENTLNDYWMSYVSNTSHGHPDQLSIGLDAWGLNFAPDLGNPGAKNATDEGRFQWIESTLSHNTVTVDAMHQLNTAGIATPLHFDDAGDVKVIDVDASNAYEQTDIYRRTLVSVNVGDVSYAVDFFRVLGGSDHIYSFHAHTENPDDVTTDGFEAVLDAVKNDAEGNPIVGSYAGADVAYGADPSKSVTASDWKYGQGFTWLKNVRRANDLTDFAVNFKITDSQGVITEEGLNLRVNMLNDFEADEVALASGHVPDGSNTNKVEDTLEYMLVRRTREGANLDSLFTAVYEPYNTERYLSEMSVVSVAPRAADAGKLGDTDVAKAIKVVRTDGRVDYIVYATNNDVIYTVTDGSVSFAFRGVVGVYSVDANGNEIYSYVLDGDIIGDATEVYTYSVYTGTVVSFTEELSGENTIYVQTSDKVNLDKLVGMWIYIENDGVENGAYEIKGAKITEDGLLALDVGTTTLIRGYADSSDLSLGYVYNIAAGQSFRIPLSYVAE